MQSMQHLNFHHLAAKPPAMLDTPFTALYQPRNTLTSSAMIPSLIPPIPFLLLFIPHPSIRSSRRCRIPRRPTPFSPLRLRRRMPTASSSGIRVHRRSPSQIFRLRHLVLEPSVIASRPSIRVHRVSLPTVPRPGMVVPRRMVTPAISSSSSSSSI